MSNLDLIKNTFLQNQGVPKFTERGIHDRDLEIFAMTNKKMMTAKQFLLDVEKSQLFYDSLEDKQKHTQINGTFELPFDECLFAFDNPLMITWRNGIGETGKEDEYVSKPVVGFFVFPLLERTKQQFVQPQEDKYLNLHKGETINIWAQTYRMVMFFLEDITKIKNIPDGTQYVLGQQYITFMVNGIKGKSAEFMYINHRNHNPCGNKLLCNIDEYGTEKLIHQRAWVCEEIIVRDAWMVTISYLINKINETNIIHKKPTNWWGESLAEKFLPSLPLGWPYTKGNLPKENYVLHLDNVNYRYDPEDINYGNGTKHRFRYDVRRHPRIVDGRVVWVDPHQRGAGKYIPKVYSNKRKWYVPYFLSIERLTKIRFIEILFIKFITFIRRFKK